MNHKLLQYIRRYIDIENEEFELFQSYLQRKTIKKKQHIFTEGRVCTSRYYIINGCLRLYYIDKKGNEQILHFGIDNWWIADYESLVNHTPSRFKFQAIQDTEYLELEHTSFEKLVAELPKVERLFRIIMEKTQAATQNRVAYMFSLSGKELYDTFISANPAFVQKVPQYMIASYLGLTPEFVSKVRGLKK